VTYGDVFHQNEVEQSTYNFEHANVTELLRWFDVCESEANKLIAAGLPLPAYEQVMKASHTFNLLDARRAISVTERQRYILARAHVVAQRRRSVCCAARKARLPGPEEQEQGAGRMSAAKSLLIELGTEELPPKALDELGAAFLRGICDGLSKRGIEAPLDQAKLLRRRDVWPSIFRRCRSHNRIRRSSAVALLSTRPWMPMATPAKR
jgi:hypothetical protein